MARSSRLSAVRACAFDAYGTLLDYGSATTRCADALGDALPKLTALWRDKQLQYTWLRTAQGRHADFRQVTADALDFSLETLGLDDAPLRERLLSLYFTLDAFAEVPAVLRALNAAGVRSAILSNGTRAMLEASITHAGIDGLLDAVLSVDAVGVFKPHRQVYELACTHFGLPPDAVLFVSANAWDAYAASAFGMRVVWCNRYAQRAERLPGAPDHMTTSLAELPELLGVERTA